MTNPPAASLPAPGVPFQTFLSLTLAAAVMGTFSAVAWLANHDGFRAWMQSRSDALWQRDHRPQGDGWPRAPWQGRKPGFTHIGSRLFVEEIPETDHTRPGVYVFGSSILNASLRTSGLRPELRELIHNYAVPGLTHTDQYHVIRFLVAEERFLSEQDQDALVVLTLFFQDAVEEDYFSSIFRYGLYSYDRANGLRPGTRNELLKYLRSQMARSTNILKVCWQRLTITRDLRLDVATRIRPASRPPPDPEAHARMLRRYMGRDWKRVMTSETEALERTIEFLKQRKAAVVLVLLPLASWQHNVPFPQVYRDRIVAISEAQGVELEDLSDLLTDDEYFDQAHPTHAGAQKTNAVLLDIALSYLRRVGRLR